MGVKRLLISPIQVAAGRSATVILKQARTDAGTRRRGRPRATWLAAGSGTPACSSMCSGVMTVAAVSAFVERIWWSLQ